MPNGLQFCSRSSQLNYSSRCFYKSNSELRRGTSPRLSIPVSLAPPKRSHSLPSLLGHPQLRSGYNSSPTPRSQNSRDFSPVQPLVLSGSHQQHSHVHEAVQVQETCALESQLSGTPELPPHCSGHYSLSRNESLLPLPCERFHARRAHVLLSLSNSRPLHRVSKTADSLLQSGCAPRGTLHRSLSLPHSLHLQNLRPDSPLHPRVSQCRFLQSASPSSVMAENLNHSFPPSPALCNQAGILGPCPLSSHSKRTSPKASHSTRHPKISISPPFLLSEQSPPSNERAVQHLSRDFLESRFLPNPGLLGTAPGHLHPATSSPPSGSNRCLQRPVHLYQSGQNPSDLRPRRLRSHSKQQARVLLGHTKRVGQSANLRAFKLPSPPPNMLPVLLKPHPKAATSFRPTLANVSFGSHPISFCLPSSPPLIQFQIPTPPPQATFLVSSKGEFSFAPQEFPTLPSPGVCRKSPSSSSFGATAPISPPPPSAANSSFPSKTGVASAENHDSDSKESSHSPPPLHPLHFPKSLPPLLPLPNATATPRQLPPQSPSPELSVVLGASGVPGLPTNQLSPTPSSPSSPTSFQSCQSPPRFPGYPPTPPGNLSHTTMYPDSPILRSRSELLERLRELQSLYPSD
ncbi:69K protein [Naranjilla chlorotic mosaic virus]|uniref:69K protein n=1 Tax=Naranjilla chlorotic mosaic virus TaxID=2073044 RepID=A0A2I7NAE9_9VIRU|nr:69K protein [Naranjilla chlorotic mosaic virus]AUR53411.1 69K protein [Naranjilla chlorotic mosaic virus]